MLKNMEQADSLKIKYQPPRRQDLFDTNCLLFWTCFICTLNIGKQQNAL